jgi:hypothetical protein
VKKRQVKRLLRESVKAILPNRVPEIELREQSLAIDKPTQPLLPIWRRIFVTMMLIILSFSTFLLFGGDAIFHPTTTVSPTDTTSTTQIPETAFEVAEQLQSADYTPDILAELGLSEGEVVRSHIGRKSPSFIDSFSITETILTELSNPNSKLIALEDLLTLLDTEGNLVETLVTEASSIVTELDQWFFTPGKPSYFMTFDLDTNESVLLSAWSVNEFENHRVVYEVRVRQLSDGAHRLTMKIRGEWPDYHGNPYLSYVYMRFVSNQSYAYYHTTVDYLHEAVTANRNAVAWELRKEGDIVIASGREESLPSESITMLQYVFHPTYVTLLTKIEPTLNLVVLTDQGRFLSKFIESPNVELAQTYELGLAGMSGWNQIVIQKNDWQPHFFSITTQQTTYSLTYPDPSLPITEAVTLTNYNETYGNSGLISDVGLLFQADESSTFDDILLAMSEMGLSIDLPNVDVEAMLTSIRSILHDPYLMLSTTSVLDQNTYGDELILLSSTEFQAIQMTDEFFDAVIAFQIE